MTTIESEKGKVNVPASEVYEDFQDLGNLKKYLPEDKISNWSSDGKTCSFKVMGTYTIGLELSPESTEELVVLKATDKSPFPFTLNLHLNQQSEELTDTQIVCTAKLNPMLKMMVVKPLKNLFDYIIKKSSEHYS